MKWRWQKILVPFSGVQGKTSQTLAAFVRLASVCFSSIVPQGLLRLCGL